MPVLEPPKALVRANGIPEPLSSKVIEGWSIPTADVSTCDDLSLVACLPSRSLSRDRPQTQVFIPHGKQTQRTEAVSGGHRLESPGDRRTLAPCSWSQCLLVLRDPREEPHLPTRRPGYPPPRLFAWGGLSLCFRWGVPLPLLPRALPSWCYGGRLPYSAAERDAAACFLRVFVPRLWNVNAPSQLASCRCKWVARLASLQEKRVTDASRLETPAPWRC